MKQWFDMLVLCSIFIIPTTIMSGCVQNPCPDCEWQTYEEVRIPAKTQVEMMSIVVVDDNGSSRIVKRAINS